MIKSLTLLAVADMEAESLIDGSGLLVRISSTGDMRPPAVADAELFFPKLNFHLDGFLTTPMEGVDELMEVVGVMDGREAGTLMGVNTPDVEPMACEVRRADGKGYMDTGSYGMVLRLDDVVRVDVDVLVCVDAFEALLISRARDSEALASPDNALSSGAVGVGGTTPLFFLAPRLRRL